MDNFTANSVALSNQSDLHRRIAQYYRNLHDQVQGPTSSIINALNATGYNGSDAATYRQFLTQDALDAILAEARSHDDWADYFSSLSQTISGLETALSEADPSVNGPRGYGHGPIPS